MSPKTTKHRQIQPKSRGLYTPGPVRGRVLARHISGASNREIAKVERIDRETVSRILTQPEIARMMEQYRSRLLMMVPKAISAYEQALDSDDERIKAAAATKLLEGLQVFPRAGIEQAKVEPEHQKRLLMLGQMMEMVLYKSERYRIPLPPGLARLEPVGSR